MNDQNENNQENYCLTKGENKEDLNNIVKETNVFDVNKQELINEIIEKTVDNMMSSNVDIKESVNQKDISTDISCDINHIPNQDSLNCNEYNKEPSNIEAKDVDCIDTKAEIGNSNLNDININNINNEANTQNDNFNLPLKEDNDNNSSSSHYDLKDSENKEHDNEYDNSYLKTIKEENSINNMLSRYAPCKTTFMKEKIKSLTEKNYEAFGGEALLLKKKLSKLEQEKEQARINKENKENINSNSNLPKEQNKKSSSNNNTITSLGDCFIKKKSKLELEKEIFNKQMQENQRLRQIEKQNKFKDQVFKLENSEFKKLDNKTETNIINNSDDNKKPISLRTCEMCFEEGPFIKGKLFTRCNHWCHNVRNIVYNSLLFIYLIF